MTFFVDANIVLYAVGHAVYGPSCADLLEAIARGDADGQTSTAVLEEIWHVELAGKIADIKGITQRSAAMFTPLLPVTDEAFRLALALPAPAHLGANDRLHIGTCWAQDIRTIVSADTSFDNIRGLNRVDPLDASAVRRLLG